MAHEVQVNAILVLNSNVKGLAIHNKVMQVSSGISIKQGKVVDYGSQEVKKNFY